MAPGIEDAATSNSSRVLMTGNAAAFIRVAGVGGVPGGDLGLDQGAQQLLGRPRWVFAVTSSSGASWRIAASLSRRSPAAEVGRQRRRAARGHDGAADGVVAQRPDRDHGQVEDQRVPGAAGAAGSRRRRPGWSARRRPASGGTRPPAPARPANACSPWAARRVFSSASSGPSRVLPGRGGAGEERLGDRAERAERLLRRGLRAAPPAAARAAARRSARRGPTPRPARPGVLGDDLPGRRSRSTSSRPSSCAADLLPISRTGTE